MTIIKKEQEQIYTVFGDISRPSEKTVFLIMYLENQVGGSSRLTDFDKLLLEEQNRLALEGCFDINKLCLLFSIARKRLERKLKVIEKKLMIEYLRENL